MLNAILLMAQTSDSSGQSGTGSSMSMIIMMVALLVVMYFMMIRPQKKRQKEEQEMRSALEIGDEIITIGGIVGKVVTIRENDIIIETGSDRNKMKILRTAVSTNVTKTEQHNKEIEAAREAAKSKREKKKNAVDETKDDVVDETK